MDKDFVKYCLNNSEKWVDKSAPRHKHEYSIQAVARVRQETKHDSKPIFVYYSVLKCKHCNSFVGIPREGAYDGYMGDYCPSNRPIIKLYKSKKSLDFKGAVLEEDKIGDFLKENKTK
jgi:hypothetical protein